MKYKVEDRREANKTAGLISDENIRLTGFTLPKDLS
jgi:hypothetical protein